MAVRYTLAGLFFVAVLVGVAAFALRPSAQPLMHTVRIGSTQVAVDIADTASLREQGLSGRTGLPDGQGMLFVFQEDGLWAFWMKDMRFSIDIIWADAQGRVITVAPDLSPDTYPQTFLPQAPARYVLEVPAGFAERHGIAEGDTIVI